MVLMNCECNEYTTWIGIISSLVVIGVLGFNFINYFALENKIKKNQEQLFGVINEIKVKIKDANAKGIEGKAYAFIAMGAAEANDGRFIEAIQLFNEAKTLFASINDTNMVKSCERFIEDWKKHITIK